MKYFLIEKSKLDKIPSVFFQLIVGGGVPLASQSKVIFLPTTVSIFLGLVTQTGGP